MTEELSIEKIKIVRPVRKSIGCLAALSELIRQCTLLHPIVVNSRYELISDYRRLEACKKLNMVTVPVRRVDSLDDALKALIAERDENGLPTQFCKIQLLAFSRYSCR